MANNFVAANSIEIEDGELSDDGSEEVYVPLPRPSLAIRKTSTCMDDHKLENALSYDGNESSNSSIPSSSDESESSITPMFLKDGEKNNIRSRKKNMKRTVMFRVNAADQQENKRQFRKYNIWTSALQEDTLTEDMRGCDVANHKSYDRNVENYDISLKYRLRNDESMKRRHSLSSEEDGYRHLTKKRRKRENLQSVCGNESNNFLKKRFQKRIGSSGSESNYAPRIIEDIDDICGKHPICIAREMAEKLNENKDELMVRIVEVLGLELPLEIYKETQRIEADGGMQIINGKRRRTPGGVFLFLLKKHQKLSENERREIFKMDKKENFQSQYECVSRNEKVEELKKRLNDQECELILLSARKDFHLVADTKIESSTENLMNPPPSPVEIEQYTDSGLIPRENFLVKEIRE